MVETKKFFKMTDDEIVCALRKIAMQCQHHSNPIEEFKRRVKKELDYRYNVAITFSSLNDAGQSMYMGMIGSPNCNKTINF